VLQLTDEKTENDVLPCLLIPVQGGRLILPNVTVAELITYQEPVHSKADVDWILGKMEWRGTMIPVVSYEIFCGQKVGVLGQNLQIAVVNAPNGDSDALRFFGLVVQGIPSLIKLEEAAIKENLNTTLGIGQKLSVTLDTGHAIVPDLDAIEEAILDQSWQ
jgi:chemosensory pili system protein ChpC